MVSSDNESQLLFNKGTEIEVTSDEEGFRGAWYQATILESPPKSVSKKRKKALIEYRYLVTEDGSTPLKEYIDPSYIRPLPPQREGGKDVFELNDVVEANYRDGWWTGTVTKVLENGKLRVCFDNPPDVLDFEEKDLRMHYEWVNGKWIRPEKLQSTGSIFSPGTAIEVNLDNKENFRDVWFPAIVIKENEDGTFFVKYQNLRNGDEATVKVTLDSHHIRPTPPRYVGRNYELLEKVDTFYGFGWRAGVITKVLAGGRYNVFFKHGNEDVELSHSDMRPHVEWTGGNWISKSKEVLIASDGQEQPGPAHNSSGNPDVALNIESSGSAVDNNEEETPCMMNIEKNQMEQSTPFHEDSAACTLPPSKKKMKLGNSNGTLMRSRPNKKLIEGTDSDSPLAVTTSHLKNMANETTKEPHGGLATPKTERTGTRCSKKPVIIEQPSAIVESPFLGKRIKIKQQKFGPDFETVDFVKRRGRPTKLQTKSLTSVTGEEKNTTLAAVDKMNENDGKEKEAEMPVIVGLRAKGKKGTQAGNPSKISDEVSLKLIRDQKKNLNDSGGNNSMPKGGGSSQRRKRGRPRKLVIISPKVLADGKEHEGVAGVVGEVVKDHTSDETKFPPIKRVELMVCQDAFGEKTGDISVVDGATKEVDMAIAVVSTSNADDDQPLSTWIGGVHSSSVEEELRLSSGRTVNGLNEARERQIDREMESSVVGFKGGSDLVENQMLPFVKKSPIWKTIESMEVFQLVPQQPHFRPLGETKEEYREGSAVGIMVTYAGLFEKISLLQFDDSRIIFDRTLESLLDLEKHGFDVTLLRRRVNKLLSIRDRQGQLLDELKDSEREIMERTKERAKLDEDMVEIGKKISELQEQLDSTKLRKQTGDLEIARLQSLVGSIKERVQSARYDFDKLAAAPWKFSCTL